MGLHRQGQRNTARYGVLPKLQTKRSEAKHFGIAPKARDSKHMVFSGRVRSWGVLVPLDGGRDELKAGGAEIDSGLRVIRRSGGSFYTRKKIGLGACVPKG